MADYTVYYDTSGHRAQVNPQDAIVTVGLIASAAQWQGFDRDWDELLRTHKLPYLHMREVPKSFRNRDAAREALLAEAVRLLKKRATHCFIVSVIPREYHVVNAEYELDGRMINPHACAIGSCVLLAEKWFERTANMDSKHVVRHVHEAGDTGIVRCSGFGRQ